MSDQTIRRADGRVERVCVHGVGHTIQVPKGHENEKQWWVHGCCGFGCCAKWRREGK